MSPAGTKAIEAARVAAGEAGNLFGAAWGGFRKMLSGAKEAGVNAAKGVGNGVKAADQYVSTRIVEDKGVWNAVKGIAKDHPVSSSLATVGAVGGLGYGGYKVVGHFTGREAERREQRNSSRERD